MHDMFLTLLEKCLARDASQIGTVFLLVGSKFLIYTDYYTNHPDSLAVLQVCNQVCEKHEFYLFSCSTNSTIQHSGRRCWRVKGRLVTRHVIISRCLH